MRRTVQPVPDKTVVLTFDDAVKSHLTVVAPLLAEKGFGATFFVTHAWMDDAENFLSWKEIARLDRLGFEVGNHSWSHVALHTADGGELARREIGRVDEELAKVGVSRPVSFSWPGNHFGPEAVAVLRHQRYRFARRGPMPEPPAGSVAGLGPLYDPRRHDPLLVPSSGLAVPEWTLADFRAVVDRARDGKIAVLQFHGVPDGAHPFCSTPPDRFRQFVDYLSQDNFHVIAMRDLAKYVDWDALPSDPMAARRFFR
jgi:peptidoglycan/xylan/chitin deacetylase (PgdA/CDA1 family)